jgi:hypothetical protein
MGNSRKPLVFTAGVIAMIAGSTVLVRSFDAREAQTRVAVPGSPGVARPAASTSPFPASELVARPRETTGEFVKRQQQLLADPAQFAAARARDLAALESQHAAEPVDPDWKREAEAALEDITASDTIAVTGIAPDTYRADCRSRLCRVSATFTASGDAEDWQNMFVTMTGNTFRQTRMHVIQTAPGAYTLEIYGARR